KVGRGSTRTAEPGRYHTTLRLTSAAGAARVVDQHYVIPPYPSAAGEAPPTDLGTSPPVDELLIPTAELVELAEKIDALRGSSGYRARHVRKMLARLRTADGVVSIAGLLGLPAGQVRLLNAPTGIGKSVLVEVIACWMAANGRVITIVVPTNADVLKLVRTVEHDLEVLGVDA